MPITSSAINLREIVCRVYKREKDRDDSAWRCGCLLASQDLGDRGWLNPSDDERSTLHAVGIEKTPLDVVRNDERLRTIVYPTWYEPARAQILEKESQNLRRSPFKKTSWVVMRDAFVEAARQLAPGFWRGAAEDLDDAFREYCEWLPTGQGTPDGKFDEAFVVLDEAGFRDELWTRLDNECREEARDIGLGEPPGGGRGRETQPVVPKRPSDDAFKAWRLRDLTGLRTQQEIADEISEQLGRTVSQGEVSRWLSQVEKYLKAGNIFPDLPALIGEPQSIDPALIEMGGRQEQRTRRQRGRRDPDTD